MEWGCQIQRRWTDLSVPYALAHSLLLSPSPRTNAIWRSSHQETSVANWCVLSGWEVDCPHIYQADMCTRSRPEKVMGLSPTPTSLFVVPEEKKQHQSYNYKQTTQITVDVVRLYFFLNLGKKSSSQSHYVQKFLHSKAKDGVLLCSSFLPTIHQPTTSLIKCSNGKIRKPRQFIYSSGNSKIYWTRQE